jgi:hypothetical protein
VGVQITSNGKITPMHNFSTGSTNANDSSVFGSVNRLYKNKDGELVYEILVPKQSAYSSSVKENELKPGVNYIIQQGEGGEKNFIEVRNTETRTVPASDVNNTIVMDITGTNPVQIYTDYLNSRGKAAAPKKGGAKPSNSGKTIPLSEWRKLSLAERQRKIKEGYTQGK